MLEHGQKFPEEDYEYYCDRCATHVSEHSKHCRRCNRCTVRFDHHWIANYNTFMALIVAYAVQLVYQVVLLFEKFMPLIGREYLWKLVLTDGILCGLLALPVTYLVMYHIWLSINNMTTYQHIQKRREKRELLLAQQRPKSKQMKPTANRMLTSISCGNPSQKMVGSPVSNRHESQHITQGTHQYIAPVPHYPDQVVSVKVDDEEFKFNDGEIPKESLTQAEPDNSPLISKRNDSQLRSAEEQQISLKHKANTHSPMFTREDSRNSLAFLKNLNNPLQTRRESKSAINKKRKNVYASNGEKISSGFGGRELLLGDMSQRGESLSIMSKIKETWIRQVEGEVDADSPRNVSNILQRPKKKRKEDYKSTHQETQAMSVRIPEGRLYISGDIGAKVRQASFEAGHSLNSYDTNQRDHLFQPTGTNNPENTFEMNHDDTLQFDQSVVQEHRK
ncbi:hypothetical protein FGO68_gene10548 [Halteria grandinella]|uniref:Palmitoyltransferase n=1 Tax=Halteria grandinella TaxID=5974 RepID=A0A8J8P627_HALGN|nr:hypothetical protein FGO68_gene10548 [Halteria grandinella]